MLAHILFYIFLFFSPFKKTFPVKIEPLKTASHKRSTMMVQDQNIVDVKIVVE